MPPWIARLGSIIHDIPSCTCRGRAIVATGEYALPRGFTPCRRRRGSRRATSATGQSSLSSGSGSRTGTVREARRTGRAIKSIRPTRRRTTTGDRSSAGRFREGAQRDQKALELTDNQYNSRIRVFREIITAQKQDGVSLAASPCRRYGSRDSDRDADQGQCSIGRVSAVLFADSGRRVGRCMGIARHRLARSQLLASPSEIDRRRRGFRLLNWPHDRKATRRPLPLDKDKDIDEYEHVFATRTME